MPVITKRLLDAIKPDGKLHIIRDDDLTGFGVQVTPAGQISFCITYTVGTKSRRRVIGRLGPMTVDQARRTALSFLAKAAQGGDPLPSTLGDIQTITDLFNRWMEHHVEVRLAANTARSYRESFDTHCRKPFGHLSPAKLERARIAATHTALADRPTAANHMIRTMRALLGWAEAQQLVAWTGGNPARGHRLYRESPSDRILSVPEIRTFITNLADAPMDTSTRRVLMLELLLAQRSGEITAMRRADVDLTAATWTITVNKSHRPHVVPLPPWAREIIKAARSEAKGSFLFPSPISDPAAADATSIDAHAVATALRRAQRPVDPKGRPVKETPDKRWVFDFRDRDDQPNPISPHDLRRSCSSYLELLGHGDFVRGAILNHSQRRNVTAKHYSAADLLKLKRSALLQWESALRRIMAGDDPFSSSLEDDRAEEARILGLDTFDDATLG